MRVMKETGWSKWRRTLRNRRMTFKGKIILVMVVGFLLLLMIPTTLVWLGSDSTLANDNIKNGKVNGSIVGNPEEKIEGSKVVDSYNPNVRVYLSQEKKVVSIPMETYLEGVVASEMPIAFEMEALKAQAMAARTYVINRLEKSLIVSLKPYGLSHQIADVTDTVQHQVYSTDKKLKKQWGSHYIEYKTKIKKAVVETKGQILTYRGKPIYAAFFSTSNGRTENSDEYFTTKYPYLVSVDSSWDRSSPKFQREVTIPLTKVLAKLEMYTKKRLDVPVLQASSQMRVVKKTTGNRIANIRIGDQTFSGREVREALGLASSDFTWRQEGNKITFTTYGYGHGVGLSQWGANLMAQTGMKAEDIVRHYYQGVQISIVKK